MKRLIQNLCLILASVSVALASQAVFSSSADSSHLKDHQERYKNWRPPAPAEIQAQKLELSSELEKELADKWGVKLVALRLISMGYMIDFRFHVLDVEKSKIFFDQQVKPYVYVEKSKAKLPPPTAPKVGAFRPTDRGANIKPNKNYYIVFGNPDSHVKPGDEITLVFGDLKIEHLTVN